jgi:tetratricopeptide (TPR) repeat protein
LTINAEIGNRRVEGSVLGNLGLLHYEQGQLKQALDYYEGALAIHREVGSRRFEGTVLGNLGLLRFEMGELEESRAQYEAAIATHRAVGKSARRRHRARKSW